MENQEEEDAASAAAAGVLKQLQDSVDACPDDPDLHFNLGCILAGEGRTGFRGRGQGSSSRAFRDFGQSLISKLRPLSRYLGHYYRGARDAQRAVKFYQRAATLNSDDEEAGVWTYLVTRKHCARCWTERGRRVWRCQYAGKLQRSHPGLSGFFRGTWSCLPTVGHIYCCS